MILEDLCQTKLNIDTLLQLGVVQEYFFLHEEKKRDSIQGDFIWNYMSLFLGLLFQCYDKRLRLLDQIADYYGEKHAFLLAFMMHWQAMLVFPTIIGMAFYFRQISRVNSGELTYEQATNNSLNALFAIIIGLWTTFVVRLWERFEAKLCNRWLVDDLDEYQNVRSGFRSVKTFDDKA